MYAKLVLQIYNVFIKHGKTCMLHISLALEI